jgi:hypothetical protein
VTSQLTHLGTQSAIPRRLIRSGRTIPFGPRLRLTSRLIVEGARRNRRAIARTDCLMLRPRDISSRSERLNADRPRRRSGARIPPVGEITENTDDDWRSKTRPIELIDWPRCHPLPAGNACIAERDPISRLAAQPNSKSCDDTSWPTLLLFLKIKVLRSPVEATAHSGHSPTDLLAAVRPPVIAWDLAFTATAKCTTGEPMERTARQPSAERC